MNDEYGERFFPHLIKINKIIDLNRLLSIRRCLLSIIIDKKNYRFFPSLTDSVWVVAPLLFTLLPLAMTQNFSLYNSSDCTYGLTVCNLSHEFVEIFLKFPTVPQNFTKISFDFSNFLQNLLFFSGRVLMSYVGRILKSDTGFTGFFFEQDLSPPSFIFNYTVSKYNFFISFLQIKKFCKKNLKLPNTVNFFKILIIISVMP